jgi:hypothetical protein
MALLRASDPNSADNSAARATTGKAGDEEQGRAAHCVNHAIAPLMAAAVGMVLLRKFLQ